MKRIKVNTLNNLITYGMLIIAFTIVTIMILTGNASRHFMGMLVPIGLNIILAVSLNLVVGYLGELSLGHAGFMSVGAYAGCLFSIYFASSMPMVIRFPLALLVGGLIAAIFGLIVGVPVLRLKGDYLAIVTLAFGQIIVSVVLNLGFTGGASGLKGTPQNTNYVVVFVVILITVFVITNLVNSKQGRAITAIRDNKIAAQSIGINITYHKLFAFCLGAFFAGVAGVLYGHNISILEAGVFDYNKSIEILVIVVLGGMCSIRVSIIAAVVITVLPEMLRGADQYRMLIYAVVLIAMMLLNTNTKWCGFKNKFAFDTLYNKIVEKNKSSKEGA